MRIVDPVDVRSTTTSAIPRCGAISAAPETGTIVTSRPTSRKKRCVRRGKEVATRGEPGVARRGDEGGLDPPPQRGGGGAPPAGLHGESGVREQVAHVVGQS